MSNFENQIVVHLQSLKRNIQTVKKIVGSSNFFYPFIKSDAYGLGVRGVLPVFLEEGLSEFGLLNIQEVESISHSNITFLLFGVMDDVSSILSRPHVIPVIHTWKDLKLFSQEVLKNKTQHRIHIKINVGMARLGFEVSEVESIISYLKEQTHLKLEGVCGHLPCGEDIGLPQGESQTQIKVFNEQVEKFKKSFSNIKAHLYNSYSLVGAVAHDIPLSFGCRVGGCLYGVKPPIHFNNSQAQKKWEQLEFSSVATLKSQVVSARIVPKNQGVSYGWNWKASEDSNIAVVNMGYADGLWRSLRNGKVLFRGHLVPIVGEICMNFFMINVTKVLGLTLPQAGEEVAIYGRQGDQTLCLNEWAKHTHSIPYELMTNLGSSVRKVYQR